MPKRLPYLIRPCIFIKLISNVMNIDRMSVGDLGSQVFSKRVFVSGVFSPVQNGTVYVAQVGKNVTVSFDSLAAITSSSGNITIDADLPPPKTLHNSNVWVMSSGIFGAGNCSVNLQGDVTIFNGFAGGFPSGAMCGFPAFSISYTTL